MYVALQKRLTVELKLFNTDFESTRASLEINSKLIKAFGYISRLIKIGVAISEVRVPSGLLRTAQPATAQSHRQSCYGTGRTRKLGKREQSQLPELKLT